MAFFLEVVLLPLPRTIEAARLNERDDRMQFAGIEECAVAFTEVDDSARQSSEIHAVHHFSAEQARPVVDWRPSLRIGRGGAPALEYGRLRLEIRTDSLELRGADPQPVTASALEQLDIANLHGG